MLKQSWDPKEQKRQLRLLHTMYGSWDIGWKTLRVNEIFKILTQGVEFDILNMLRFQALELLEHLSKSDPCLTFDPYINPVHMLELSVHPRDVAYGP